MAHMIRSDAREYDKITAPLSEDENVLYLLDKAKHTILVDYIPELTSFYKGMPKEKVAIILGWTVIKILRSDTDTPEDLAFRIKMALFNYCVTQSLIDAIDAGKLNINKHYYISLANSPEDPKDFANYHISKISLRMARFKRSEPDVYDSSWAVVESNPALIFTGSMDLQLVGPDNFFNLNGLAFTFAPQIISRDIAERKPYEPKIDYWMRLLASGGTALHDIQHSFDPVALNKFKIADVIGRIIKLATDFGKVFLTDYLDRPEDTLLEYGVTIKEYEEESKWL